MIQQQSLLLAFIRSLVLVSSGGEGGGRHALVVKVNIVPNPVEVMQSPSSSHLPRAESPFKQENIVSLSALPTFTEEVLLGSGSGWLSAINRNRRATDIPRHWSGREWKKKGENRMEWFCFHRQKLIFSAFFVP